MTKTAGDRLTEMTLAFKQAGLDTPRLDARILLGHVMDKEATYFITHGDTLLSEAEEKAIKPLIDRRLKKEPISRILGERDFYGLTFALNEGTLDPRPDSETLIETVLQEIPDQTAPLRILDMGTGTGCLLLTLLDLYPNASGIGADISQDAVTAAEENAIRHDLGKRVSFFCGNWEEKDIRAQIGDQGPYDLLISNPPYIDADAYEKLDEGVKNYDPKTALLGGEDGLAPYRILLPFFKEHAKSDALIAVEIGFDQRKTVGDIAKNIGFSTTCCAKDLGGNDRILYWKKTLAAS